MNHEERMRLARFLTEKLVENYGKHILFIGVYGSVARGEDKEFSDLELIVIAKRKIPTKLFVYKGIVVLIHSVTYKDALKALGNVDDPWWFGWVGSLLYAKRLYGSEKLLDEFKERMRSISSEDYKRAAVTSLFGCWNFLIK